MKRREDTLSLLYLIMKFTQAKYMICWTITKNWKFRKTRISKLLCVDCM